MRLKLFYVSLRLRNVQYTTCLHVTLCWPLCSNLFKLFFLGELEFVIGLCSGGWRVSPSISHQTLLRCRLQDPGCDGGLVKASVWDWSLLSGRILNLFSEYKITLQTLRDSPWNFLPPFRPQPPASTQLLRETTSPPSKYFMELSLHSLRLVSGEDGVSEGAWAGMLSSST